MTKKQTELPPERIFDPNVERSDLSYGSLDEHPFKFLDRSGWPDAEEARSKMNRWYSFLPVKHREGMLHNLKGISEYEFHTASFELFVLGLFRDSGWDLEGVELAKSQNDQKPDFLFRSTQDDPLKVEATVATGVSDDERDQNIYILRILSEFEKCDSPVFRFTYRIAHIKGKVRPLDQRLQEFKTYIQELSADNLKGSMFKIQLNDYQLQLYPELRPCHSNNHKNIIGLRSRIRSFCKCKNNLRGAIKKKLNKYTDINEPLLIALNDFDNRRNEHDMLSILFGSPSDDTAQNSQSGRGLLNGCKKSDRSHVSGVLYFRKFSPLLSCSSDVTLIKNPHAIRPLPELNLNSNIFEGNFIRYIGLTKIPK